MGAARDVLARASQSNGSLTVDGEPLTVELVKGAIRRTFTEHNVASDDFIVSHGAQTAIGHELGHGEIAPDEPIVIDLWPKDPESSCYADMTRTFVVGTPPDELVEYHRLVKEALDKSLEATKAGVPGVDIFRLVCEHFEAAGQPTVLSKKPGEVLEDGFFHGLGHGVGLEVHEAPNLGRGGTAELIPGDVVTLEPGLYRQGFGGCRLEDLVVVTEDGAENLTELSLRSDAMSSDARSPAIETMFLEERRYPPPEEFAAQANAQPEIYERDFEEFWESEGRERVSWFEPFSELLRVGAAVREVVPRREAERLLQLRRPPRRGRAGREGRLPLGGRARGRAADDHVRRPAARGGQARERA